MMTFLYGFEISSFLVSSTVSPSYSEREEERQQESHDHAHYDLERQTNLDIVAERVFASVHDERVGRCGEGGGEAHAGSQRHGK